ncbi:MAG: tetratricopeptide repeat protein [Gemmatimonadota bacterium]
MASSPAKDLLERRVPQYVAVYLGASWAAIEFLTFLEDRLLVSPHLTNLVLVLLVLLLPSVVLFTYHHGRPGADQWHRIEKLFIPANVAIAAVVLLAAFSGKELGAVITTVSTEDEAGRSVRRAVPKPEFRKRLALFPLDAPKDSAWLGSAAVYALAADLAQDVFLDLRTPVDYAQLLREQGLSSAASVPRPLKREVVRDLDMGHFVDGSIGMVGGAYRMRLALHESGGGNSPAELTVDGADLFEVVDSVSREVRRALDLPGAHVVGSKDLPVADILTESVEALHEYVIGLAEYAYAADYAAAETRFRRAVELDPTFAAALYSLFAVRILTGDEAGAEEALEATMAHLYRLPERDQYAAKAEYHFLRGDAARALAVQELRAELYPQDVQAHLEVAHLRRLRGDLPGVLDALEHAMELDPSRTDLLREVGAVHKQLGHLAAAEDYYRRVVERLPDRPGPYIDMAALQALAGEHDNARGSYERALVLDPASIDAQVGLARLARYLGQWSEAERWLAAALEGARTAQARETVYREMCSYRGWRGDFAGAVEAQADRLRAMKEYQPPIYVIQYEIIGLGDMVRAGRAVEARRRLDSLVSQLPAPADRLLGPIGRTELWLALEQPDSAAPPLAEAEAAIRATGFEVVAAEVALHRGQLHEQRGEWDEAARAYQRGREKNPADPMITARLGRVYAELGETQSAESLLLQALAVWPSDARANYDLGRLYLDLERPEDAVPHLEQAVDTWAEADGGFRDARDARALLEDARLRAESGRMP